MAAQKGREILIKISNGDSPETFATVAGLRSGSFSLNDEAVDVTNQGSTGRWRELIKAGVRTLDVSGSGVFLDSASEAAMLTQFQAETIVKFELTVPGFKTFTGPMMIASLEYAGEHNGEVTYSLSLSSAGEITIADVA